MALGVGREDRKDAAKLRPLREVAGGDAVVREGRAQFPEARRLRVVVHPVERGQLVLAGEAGDGLVRREHKLLDQLVAFVVLHAL